MGAKRTSSTCVPTSNPISMRRGRFSGGNLISATVATVPRGTVVRGWTAATIKNQRLGSGGDGLDNDGFRQFFANAEPRVTNLANQIGFARQQFDCLLLTEAKLSQTLGHLGRGRKLLDANKDRKSVV